MANDRWLIGRLDLCVMRFWGLQVVPSAPLNWFSRNKSAKVYIDPALVICAKTGKFKGDDRLVNKDPNLEFLVVWRCRNRMPLRFERQMISQTLKPTFEHRNSLGQKRSPSNRPYS